MLRALETWVRGGGRLALTGDLPGFDETCQPRAKPAFADLLYRAAQRDDLKVVSLGQGRLAWAREIERLAPIPEEERKLLYLSSTALHEAVEKLPAALPPVERPLLGLLDSLLGERLAWTDRADLPGLRATCYWRREGAGAGARLVLHLLNYEPEPARDVPISLPLPEEDGARWRRASLRLHLAGAEQPTALSGEIRRGRLVFTVPEVVVHMAVEAEMGGGVSA